MNLKKELSSLFSLSLSFGHKNVLILLKNLLMNIVCPRNEMRFLLKLKESFNFFIRPAALSKISTRKVDWKLRYYQRVKRDAALLVNVENVIASSKYNEMKKKFCGLLCIRRQSRFETR